jgi:DNA ligase 1
VKMKRSYSDKVNDTLDCVVLGYDKGKGKRAAFGIGAALLGVFDETQGKYLSISKIGTGLTDDEWRNLKKMADANISTKLPDYYEVKYEMSCDVWIEPKIVLEIRSDEITTSKLHTSGYGLRFPRLERFRTDKKPQDSTTLSEIGKISKSPQ